MRIVCLQGVCFQGPHVMTYCFLSNVALIQNSYGATMIALRDTKVYLMAI